MQNGVVQERGPIEVPHARAMIPRLNHLLAVCRTHKLPVMSIHHVNRWGDNDAGRLADHYVTTRTHKVLLAGSPMWRSAKGRSHLQGL